MNLITPRLLLRPLRDSDAEAIARQVGDYDVCKTLARVPYPYGLADAREFLDWVREEGTGLSLFRALTLKGGDDQLVGVISYEYSADHDDAELGYWLAKPLWNQGYMGEAARAMVDRAFAETALATLVSGYFPANQYSGRILRRAGFEETGLSRVFSRAQDCDVDCMRLRLTRQRWSDARLRTRG